MKFPDRARSLIVALGLLATACGSAASTAAHASDNPRQEPPSVPEPQPPSPRVEQLGTPLPPAPIGFDGIAVAEAALAAPVPVSLTIESLNVDADIVAVGVNPDLSLEVPPAAQTGWYRFGAVPGAEGSAVLAGHIAFDGVDGVFRHLVDAEVGAVVAIGFDDGTTRRFRIDSLSEYRKEALPDALFRQSGDPQVALITCGGVFNPRLRSYESNVVAVAVPV